MANEVIRDVVIRLKLEQQDATLQVDTTEATRALEAFEAASNAAQQAGVRQGDAQQNAAMKAADAVRDQLDAVTDAEKASRALADAQNNQLEATLRAGDALKQAGDGAFTFARGLALVTADTDEDLRETIETLAAFQGAFDIFRGGVDFIRVAVEAQRALSAATAASAAAEAARGAAVAATGAAAATATPQLAAMNLVVGPVGVAVAGIGAALTLGYTLWRQWGDEAEDAGDRAGVAARRALADLRRAQDESAALQQQIGRSRRFQRPGQRIDDIDSELASIGSVPTAASVTADLNRLREARSETERQLAARQSDPTARARLNRRLQSLDRAISVEGSQALRDATLARDAGLRRQDLIGERFDAVRQQRSEIDRDISDATRRRGAAEQSVRAAELQRAQREARARQLGGVGSGLLSRATDDDALRDLNARELGQLARLFPSFATEVREEGFARNDPSFTRSLTVQQIGQAAERELQRAEQDLEAANERRLEAERENGDAVERTRQQVEELRDVILGLGSAVRDLQEFRQNVTDPN